MIFILEFLFEQRKDQDQEPDPDLYQKLTYLEGAKNVRIRTRNSGINYEELFI
jgi:hypothetical protein